MQISSCVSKTPLNRAQICEQTRFRLSTHFDYLKSYLWQAIRPDDTVSARRFRIGLLLFFIPLVYAWLSPYMELWITGMDAFRMHLAVTGDVIFAISLFVLGGDFWLKLKNLFTHD